MRMGRSLSKSRQYNRKNSICISIILLILLFLLICLATSLGVANVSPNNILKVIASKIPLLNHYYPTDSIRATTYAIIWNVRLPRVLLSALTGGALAIVGATFQGIFRNPLADPHILGVSSGAALGATIAMLSGINVSLFGLGVIGVFAFIGAIGAVILVYGISRLGLGRSVINMLLIGTALSTMFSSIISLLMTFNHDKIEKVYMWTLGSFSAASWDKVRFLAIFVVIGFLILICYTRQLNVILTGEETAKTLGINTKRVMQILIIVSSLLVAASVSVCGIIGFVGLIIPHCVRLISGPDYRTLLPYSFFVGAGFMIFSDMVARMVAQPSEIPVGIITAIIGAPYFVFILFYRQRKVRGSL